MKVGDLKQMLEYYDDDLEVIIRNIYLFTEMEIITTVEEDESIVIETRTR